MRLEAGNSTTRPQPLDVYLGFEIVQEGGDRFIAMPQGWADRQAPELEAADLPTLRKLIWDWWFNLPR